MAGNDVALTEAEAKVCACKLAKEVGQQVGNDWTCYDQGGTWVLVNLRTLIFSVDKATGKTALEIP